MGFPSSVFNIVIKKIISSSSKISLAGLSVEPSLAYTKDNTFIAVANPITKIFNNSFGVSTSLSSICKSLFFHSSKKLFYYPSPCIPGNNLMAIRYIIHFIKGNDFIVKDDLIELGEALKSGICLNSRIIIADLSGIGAQDVAITEFILLKS